MSSLNCNIARSVHGRLIPRLRRGVRWQTKRDTAFEAVEFFESQVSLGAKAVSPPPHSRTLRCFE